MNNKIKTAIVGVCSGVVSSAATYILAKKYYEKKVQTELDALQEYTKEIKNSKPKNDYNVEKELEKAGLEALSSYTNSLPVVSEDMPLASDSIVLEDLNVTKDEKEITPYSITSEEFGEFPQYDLRYVNWNSKEQLMTDETDEVLLGDYKTMFGESNLRQLDEGEDIIWVRDDIKGIDYEITMVDED